MAVHQPFPRGTFKVEPGPGKNEVSVIFKPTQSTIVFSVTDLWRGRRPQRQRLVGGNDPRSHRQGRGCNRQGAGDQALAHLGGDRRLTPEERKFYETYNQPDFNNPLPWAQGPRRMGTDKNGDVLWVGNSWGANLARIDIRTNETSYVPLPGQQQPYHVIVDKSHNAWTNLWGADRVLRYDPTTSAWTAFDLPTRGAEPRYVSLLERDGQPMQVVLPYFRARKVAVMTLRSEADLQALKTQATRP